MPLPVEGANPYPEFDRSMLCPSTNSIFCGARACRKKFQSVEPVRGDFLLTLCVWAAVENAQALSWVVSPFCKRLKYLCCATLSGRSDSCFDESLFTLICTTILS